MSSDSAPPRIMADFNSGGRDGERGIVYLDGKRNGGALSLDYAEQFAEAGVGPVDGLSVVLFEPDDFEVDATLAVGQRGWIAVYRWNEIRRL